MRKLLWLVVLFGAYVWIMTSGHEQFVLQQIKSVYQAVVDWFHDAEVDYQTQQKQKLKKRSRRWD